jgi:CubicO group peptidase (beta-lactamase class C family)
MRSVLSLALLLAVPAAAQQVAPAEPTPYQRAIAAGYKALTLCSGIFNAKRTEKQIEADELAGIYPEYAGIVPTLGAEVDENNAGVSVAFSPDLPPRRADLMPTGGCTLRPIAAATDPITDLRKLPPPQLDPRRWPLGDDGIAPRPSPVLASRVAAAFDGRTYGAGKTIGVVILRDGSVAAERYADGWGPLVPNRTWSVAKSIAGTLIGLAGVGVSEPASIARWLRAGDPRGSIVLDNLLRMASGLGSDTAGNRTDAIYFGGGSVEEDATHWPLIARPGTRFRYANNDILLAVRSVRERMEADDEMIGPLRYAAWPRALFQALGMKRTAAEQDWRGDYILSSQVWSTARDLARLGQLWLQDGVWQGKRLLPEGWMTYMTTPSGPQPATGPGYGATLWLFGPKQGLPAGSYAAQGNRGQYVMVIPSERLVIVRRGEDPGPARFDIARFAADVMKAR